jgi:AGZA family xanthine/uracil permease-like MFS transporter
MSLVKAIEKYFEFAKHKTNLRTEFVAGLSTFLSLSYIFIVNPSILSKGGMNPSTVLFATIATSFLATFVMGLWAKKPFALAPGLEMNSYVAFFVIGTLGFTWQQALGACFWSGVLFLILTLSNIRLKIIEAIPDRLKVGLSAAVGIFLIIIALRLSGIMNYDGVNIKSFGSPFTNKGLILFLGLAIILSLNYFKFKSSILVAIIIASVTAYFVGIRNDPNAQIALNRNMLSGLLKVDFSVILNPKIFSAIIILFLIDFYGSIAKIIGLTLNTSIVDNDGTMPKLKEALVVDGAGTMLGAGLGTSSITVYVESGVGIGMGGRSGMTAIVCAIFMLFFLPLAPMLNLVPVEATTGALLWVGLQLMPKWKDAKQFTWVEIVSVLVMLLLVAFTFSLDKAMLFGFITYLIGKLITGERKEINPYLLISAIFLLAGAILTYIYKK